MNKVVRDYIRLQMMVDGLDFVIKKIEEQKRIDEANKKALQLEVGLYKTVVSVFAVTLVVASVCEYFFG